jgi:phosphatidylethanolamine-binding protein (PEBP) family uncharacterized protein
MKKIVLGIVSVGLLSLGACQTMKEAKNVAELGVSFAWKDSHRCSSVSPAFKIASVPSGTKTLKFWMTDLQVTSFTHGGGSVEYKGSGDIPEGAFGYTGPCPPSGSHQYEFKVTAINAAGDTVLGRGTAMRPFPPQ